MTRNLSSSHTSFRPRLTKAECEFWFEAGADWQEQTERQMETQFALAFPDVSAVSEPFLWFEPNYLAVLSGPTGDGAAHADIEAHSACITRALAAYQDAARPNCVRTLFLSYQFEFDAGILPCGPSKIVWEAPCEIMTLEQEAPCGGLQTRLEFRCLITNPAADCLNRPSRWLERIHHRMEGAFHQTQMAAR